MLVEHSKNTSSPSSKQGCVVSLATFTLQASVLNSQLFFCLHNFFTCGLCHISMSQSWTDPTAHHNNYKDATRSRSKPAYSRSQRFTVSFISRCTVSGKPANSWLNNESEDDKKGSHIFNDAFMGSNGCCCFCTLVCGDAESEPGLVGWNRFCPKFQGLLLSTSVSALSTRPLEQDTPFRRPISMRTCVESLVLLAGNWARCVSKVLSNLHEFWNSDCLDWGRVANNLICIWFSTT